MRTGENIYKRKDKRWEARYKNGYREDGSVKYSSVYAKTYKEVKRKRDEILFNKHNNISNKDITLNEAFELYITSVNNVVKQSTISTYYNIYNNHLKHVFGGLKLKFIDSSRMNMFVNQKIEQNLSNKYINDIIILLCAILNQAKKLKYNINDDFYIKKLSNTEKEIQVFNKKEQLKLESYLINNINSTSICILLSISLGLRLGEICALKVADISFKDCTITINKTMQRIKNLDKQATTKTKIIIDTPKSKKSIRILPIPYFLVKILKKYVQRINKNVYLTTLDIYKFIENRTLANRYKKTLEICNIDYKCFHTLRHTFATNCVVYNTVDIKTLSEFLGHSNVNMTLNRYVHSTFETKKEKMQNVNLQFLSRHFSCQDIQERRVV